jgi:predicted branched-subunit amino acid permease
MTINLYKMWVVKIKVAAYFYEKIVQPRLTSFAHPVIFLIMYMEQPIQGVVWMVVGEKR